MRVNYDKRFDVLYLSFSDSSQSYGHENPDGFVVLHDLMTEEVTGVTIFDFMERYVRGLIPEMPLPIPVNYTNDVIPLIRKTIDRI